MFAGRKRGSRGIKYIKLLLLLVCLEKISILFQADYSFLFIVRHIRTFSTYDAYPIRWTWLCMYLHCRGISHIGWLMTNPRAYVVITTTYIWTHFLLFIFLFTATFRPYIMLSFIPVDDYFHVRYFTSHILSFVSMLEFISYLLGLTSSKCPTH